MVGDRVCNFGNYVVSSCATVLTDDSSVVGEGKKNWGDDDLGEPHCSNSKETSTKSSASVTLFMIEPLIIAK